MFLEANQIKIGHTEDKFEKDMKPLLIAFEKTIFHELLIFPVKLYPLPQTYL